MATNKTGFEYYNVDTDRYQDIKIKRLKKDKGCAGITVYDYLLCQIYRDKGYFLEFDDNVNFDVAEYFGLEEDETRQIVEYCCMIGLFNKKMFEKFGVLTSLSIQERYINTSQRAKRKNYEIQEKYMIIPEESSIIPEQSDIIHEDFNEEKRREEKKREENIPPLPPMGEPDKIDYQKLGELFNSMFKGILPQVTLPLSEARKAPIRARVKEYGKEKILEMFNTAYQSPHLLGHNDRGWKASFDWLFKPTNFPKVIEGNYLDKHGSINQFTEPKPFTGRNDAADRRASVANAKNLAIAVLQFDQTQDTG